MSIPGLTAANDASPGDWIAPRLHGKFGAVTLAVPSGFAAYVRICHPVRDRHGKVVQWSEVAGATGRKSHSLMQWHALVGSSDSDKFKGSLWKGGNPERGNLDSQMLRVLCEQLAEHTEKGDDCYFCIWGGYGGLESYGWLEDGSSKMVDEKKRHLLSSDERKAPRLHLPDRNYLVLVGPLRGALRIGSWVGADSFWSQSPNLFWPSDRAWFVASEIDFDSTLVAGSVDLVEAILESPTLDAWRVQPDDSLAADADTINLVSP